MIYYYNTLFSIECFHQYYTDGFCRDLQVEPTEECFDTLKGYGLLFKQRDNGGVVIVEQNNTGTEMLPVLEPKVPLEAGTVFTFKICLKNPLFLNITAVDQKEIEPFSVFVFSNKPGAVESIFDGIRSIQVHDGPLAGPVQAVGKVFRHHVNLSLNPVLLAVHDESGLLLSQIPVNSTMPGVTVDLGGYPEGRYELRSLDAAGVVVQSQKVFAGSDFLSPRLFGFLQVRYTPEIMGHSEKQHAFTLDFESRRIDWIYKINVEEIEPGEGESLALNNIQLQRADLSTNFSKSVSLAEPRQVIFSSDDRIKLREKPYKGIQLKDGAAVDADVLIKNMPNPEIDRLVKDEASDLRSEMYLTIK